MSKEMWIDAVEAETMRLIDEEGMDEQEAYELACERGCDLLADRMADIADTMRQRAKDGLL